MDNKTLINIIAQRLDINPEEVEANLLSLSEIIVEVTKQGDSVAIPGFGQFEPRMRDERVTTHPSTGKKILVPPKVSMVFKPSALLKQKVK